MRKHTRSINDLAIAPDVAAFESKEVIRAVKAGISTDDLIVASHSSAPIVTEAADTALSAASSFSRAPAARPPGPIELDPIGGHDGGEFTTQAVTGTFSAGTLSTFGDNLDNGIQISRNAAGTLLINGGAVAVQGGTPTVANTSLIQVFGQGGNDVITLNEANGAVPRANLFGGVGNDTLTGGSGADMLFGQSGNDTLLGRGGNDFLFGGSDNDILIGGDGNDQIFGEAGDDRMIWNPGDDTDLMEGGSGTDTVEVNGANGAEAFTATANGTRVRFDRINPAPFALDIGTTEHLVVNMNGGDDTFSATGNLAALISVTVDGGAGNDTILGSNGVDLLLGGDGNDFIDGQQGNDVIFLGAGNDVMQWDPGDGSDVVEGQDGTDTMRFNGSAANETFAASANGGRVLFTRNVGNIVMDLNDMEAIQLNALGGADTITINDLSGTDARAVNVSLAGTLGGTSGDAAADTVIANATNGNNNVQIVGSGSAFSVLGLPVQINVTQSEGANDAIVINALGGDDTINATGLGVGVVKLTVDGGAGNDTITGSIGADVLLGGEGNDFIEGKQGNDLALMGAGNDVFQWGPGDGNDTVEGQEGNDTLRFLGSNAGENINIVANGARVLFTRDVAAVTMDLDDVEVVEFRAQGGADNILIGDLSGTDVTRVDVDLRGVAGGADGAVDTVTVNATPGADVFGVFGDAGGVTVFGLPARVNIFQQDSTDRLVLNGLGGDDVIDASSLAANAIQLTVNGGLGNDVIIGGAGNDLINGGDGNDLALMGAGDDVFVWNPGDDNDTLEGQTGFDTMLFNGANVSENITIFANGGRAMFFRNVANVTMDTNDVERFTFNALGGADNIVVNDLTGTDVREIDINLASSTGVGDGAPDRVQIDATAGEDVIQAFGDAAGISVIGLTSRINITRSEAANDQLLIMGGAGDDVIDASGVAAGAIMLTLDGGDGNDILIGSDGDDVLIGGNGDDVLIGGLGNDIIIGGPGDDFEIQGFTSSQDVLDLRAFNTQFDALMANATEEDGDVILNLGDQQITLRGVSMSSLQQEAFLL